MPKLPPVNAREVIAALVKGGFEIRRQRGAHVILVHYERKRTTSVSDHGGRDVPVGTLHSILKQAGLTAEEFLGLLE